MRLYPNKLTILWEKKSSTHDDYLLFNNIWSNKQFLKEGIVIILYPY